VQTVRKKGRYREFYQCDADIVGSKSLLNEAELASLYSTIFEKLKVNAEIKINSRNILTALAQSCHAEDKLIHITTAIDKIDKTGIEKVKEELRENGLNEVQVTFIENYLSIKGNNEEKLSALEKLISNNAYSNKGIAEIKTLLSFQPQLTIDFTLARGLNYYTGIIFEVKAKDVSIGSIGGGGRYDDLTGIFGVPNLPGVGISFGVERIYDVMEELNLFPPGISNSTQVLFFNLGEKRKQLCFYNYAATTAGKRFLRALPRNGKV